MRSGILPLVMVYCKQIKKDIRGKLQQAGFTAPSQHSRTAALQHLQRQAPPEVFLFLHQTTEKEHEPCGRVDGFTPTIKAAADRAVKTDKS